MLLVIGQCSGFKSLTYLVLWQIPTFLCVKVKYIRIGITVFKIFIWGGKSSDIPLELFYSNASKISDGISDLPK